MEYVMPRLIRTERGVYLGDNPTKPLAKIDFSRSNDGIIVIQHTFVSESLKGQGVGRVLVQEVIAIAREKQLKILPLCPFARRVMAGDEACRDILVELPAGD